MRRLRISEELFLCKVAAEITQENGSTVRGKRTYGIGASSWGDAEKKITEYLAPYGEVEILDIRKPKIAEVYGSDAEDADKWYTVKVEIITFDEYRNREKRTAVYFLFQARTLDEASKMAAEAMADTLSDYDKMEIKDSGIFDVIEDE